MKKCKVKYKTDFLLPNNDFIVGMGSIFNVAGKYFNYNTSNSSNDADCKTLYSDWENVGNDLPKSHFYRSSFFYAYVVDSFSTISVRNCSLGILHTRSNNFPLIFPLCRCFKTVSL